MIERFETFTVQIAKISRAIRRIKTEEMAEFALKSPHVSCIYYLYERGALTSKELGELCAEDKAALSRSVEYLEENGYVASATATKKRYKTPLALTDKGMAVGKRISEKINAVLEQAGKDLSEEDRAVFYRSLAVISDNLQKICEEYED